uniref:GLTSCR protein conserved domain-containing protein n=1 Tax=Anabas testudineus TaxID=64144 RepID=A0A7N6BSN2_ANATE
FFRPIKVYSLPLFRDVDALNDYLHGSNSNFHAVFHFLLIVSYFLQVGSNSGLKDGSSSMGDFCEDSAGAGLQLSSSLSFIEDELGTGSSPGGMDLGGEDQPFDILQKSLLEADITEQTLAQEALLDTQPAPTLVQAPVPFTSQLVSGGYGGGVGVVTTAAAAFPTGQFLQGVSQLSNGSAQHIQVLGSFGAGGGVMTLSSLERSPQIVLRPGAPVAAAGTTTGGQVFAPTQGQVGQVGLPFKNIPLQNIIIQRGSAGPQSLVRPIQPKPLQGGTQAVYSLGLQPTPTTMANVVNANNVTGGPYTANGSIVVQSPLDQQQVQAQTNLPPGQFLLPNSLPINPASTMHNGPADPSSNALITSQNTVQIVAGRNFAAPAGAQLILNQGVVSGSHVGGGATQTWTGASCVSSAPVQTSCTPGQLTLVDPATMGLSGQGQLSASPVQRLLVTQTQNCTSLSPLPGTMTQEQDFRQVGAQKRPALPPLTKGGMVLQQLRKDHAAVHTPDRRQFTSIDDALQRLLPYHVFQGAPPCQDDFSQVDEEFEIVATQVLNRTQAMVNKYRRLLMVEAEVSTYMTNKMPLPPLTFNQEERSNLTQDKRMVLVDPGEYKRNSKTTWFFVYYKRMFKNVSSLVPRWLLGGLLLWDEIQTFPGAFSHSVQLHPPLLENKSVLELKRSQQRYGPSSASNNSHIATNSYPQGNTSPFAAPSGGQTHFQVSHHASSQPIQPQYPPRLSSPPHLDTDSALEAAVNSILEC